MTLYRRSFVYRVGAFILVDLCAPTCHWRVAPTIHRLAGRRKRFDAQQMNLDACSLITGAYVVDERTLLNFVTQDTVVLNF